MSFADSARQHPARDALQGKEAYAWGLAVGLYRKKGFAYETGAEPPKLLQALFECYCSCEERELASAWEREFRHTTKLDL